MIVEFSRNLVRDTLLRFSTLAERTLGNKIKSLRYWRRLTITRGGWSVLQQQTTVTSHSSGDLLWWSEVAPAAFGLVFGWVLIEISGENEWEWFLVVIFGRDEGGIRWASVVLVGGDRRKKIMITEACYHRRHSVG